MKYKTIFSILVIVLLVVAAFFFFKDPITQVLTGKTVSDTKEEIVAQVNGMPVTLPEVTKAQQYIQAQTGKAINETEALESVISNKLMFQDAENHGFTQTTEETENEISKILIAQNRTLEGLKADMTTKKIDYEATIESYRQQLLVNKYLNDAIVKTNITEAQTLEYYNKNKNTMFTNATVPYEQISKQLKAALEKKQGQEEITAYLASLHENATIVYLKK